MLALRIGEVLSVVLVKDWTFDHARVTFKTAESMAKALAALPPSRAKAASDEEAITITGLPPNYTIAQKELLYRLMLQSRESDDGTLLRRDKPITQGDGVPASLRAWQIRKRLLVITAADEEGARDAVRRVRKRAQRKTGE